MAESIIQTKLQDFIPSLSDMPVQHAEWLVDGFIHQGAVTVISGEAGCGKTTWALGMAGAISEGLPFAGLKTKQAPVLYMDKENPHMVAQEKLRLQGTKTGPDFLYWGLWVEPSPTALWHPRIAEYVQQCPVKPLIVVDSLGAFYMGDENENGPMRRFFEPLSTLAAAGASVIIIHHTGKSETSKVFRGAQAIKDCITAGFFVDKINSGQMLEQISVKAWKSRIMTVDEQVFNYSDGRFTAYHGPKIRPKVDGFANVNLIVGR